MKAQELLATVLITVVTGVHPAWAEPATAPLPLPTAIDLSKTTDEFVLPNLTEDEQQMLDLFQADKCGDAKKIVQAKVIGSHTNQDRAQQLELLAYVDQDLGQPRKAIKDLQQVPMNDVSNHTRIVTLKRIADMYLRMRKKSAAVANYKLAFDAAQKQDANDPILIAILEPLVGCLVEDGKYKEARPYAEHLQSICETCFKSDDPSITASLFWAGVQLSQVYKNTNHEQFVKFQTRLMPYFDRLLEIRSQKAGGSAEEAEAASEKFQKTMLHSYVKDNKPVTFSDYLWITSEFRPRSLPLIDWQTPDDRAKAIILCVHGLGLENRAFGFFGREMAGRHFAVYAMDVRGFGAWQSEYGSESVNFDRTLNDIDTVLGIIRHRNPDAPIFLLGESMGGAIVLRAAPELGTKIAGVISSVPSAERYQEKKLAAKVALHLLRSPNKPFDIGSQVKEQSTSRTDMLNLWTKDQKAKMSLSPIELMKFDRFMRITKKRCSLIRTTPVVVVQGMEDKLAKPKGTYEMYHDIQSPDKTMIIIGSAEHLIFETPHQSQVLLDGVTSWIGHHLTTKDNPQPHSQATSQQ